MQVSGKVVDDPARIEWLGRERPLPAGEGCRHPCGHGVTMVVARSGGPGRRELRECLGDIKKGGCGGGCRAWFDENGVLASAWTDVAPAAS